MLSGCTANNILPCECNNFINMYSSDDFYMLHTTLAYAFTELLSLSGPQAHSLRDCVEIWLLLCIVKPPLWLQQKNSIAWERFPEVSSSPHPDVSYRRVKVFKTGNLEGEFRWVSDLETWEDSLNRTRSYLTVFFIVERRNLICFVKLKNAELYAGRSLGEPRAVPGWNLMWFNVL